MMPRLLPAMMLALFAHAACADGLLKPHENSGEILPVDEAFQLQPALWQDGHLLIGIDAAPGCYLYRDKIKVEVLEPAGYALGPSELPAGDAHHDEHFGDVRILRDRVVARYRPKLAQAPRQVRVRYQGCAENLVCYPPQERVLNVETVR
jgi:thiol:disulfide interchange protein